MIHCGENVKSHSCANRIRVVGIVDNGIRAGFAHLQTVLYLLDMLDSVADFF